MELETQMSGHCLLSNNSSRIPKDRILTESDGPFIKAGKQSTTPYNVVLVNQYLAQRWDSSYDVVTSQLDRNFNSYTKASFAV
jgi:TatD DNase family protein